MYHLNLKHLLQPLYVVIAVMILAVLLSACGSPAPPPKPTPPPLAEELILYDWEEDMPQSVLDAFADEYGVKVIYLTYEEQEEAIENMKSGEVYDIVVLENQFIPTLNEQGLLAEINFQNVPNIKNVAASFRDLAYDPGNKYSIPYNWGTTGLIVRNDKVEDSVTRWADLWDPSYIGKIGLYATETRAVIALALKSLGYSINSEKPEELEAALEHLLALESVIFTSDYSTAPLLVEGQAVIALGYASDAEEAQAEVEEVSYILPEEGAILWGDNFVIPANSPNKFTAELFLDFLLRANIGAQLTNETSYATPNEAAHPFIDSEILYNPDIFPPNEALANAEILLPLSADGEALYADVWERFTAAQ